MLKTFLNKISPKFSDIDLKALESRSGAVLNLNLYALGLIVRDIEFRAVLERARMIHLDGFGASLVVRLATGKWFAASGYRAWGMQMFDVFEGRPFLLLGGTPEESKEALKKIVSQYPGLDIQSVDGYQTQEFSLEKIQEISGGVIIVGQGMPRQELLIGRALENNDGNLFFPCGGWIKQIAGFEDDVPNVYKKLKLEWFYRSMNRPGHFSERVLSPLICVFKNFR